MCTYDPHPTLFAKTPLPNDPAQGRTGQQTGGPGDPRAARAHLAMTSEQLVGNTAGQGTTPSRGVTEPRTRPHLRTQPRRAVPANPFRHAFVGLGRAGDAAPAASPPPPGRAGMAGASRGPRRR